MTDTNSALREAILTALSALNDPESGKPLPQTGRLQGLTIRDGGAVGFVIETSDGASEQSETLRKEAESIVSAISGVSRVTAVLTAHNSAPPSQTAKPATTRQHATPAQKPAGQKPVGQKPTGKEQSQDTLPDIGAIVAITSAKGGVGKSTIAANLAVACAELGLRVGLLDADVYGPSTPTMFGTADRKPEPGKNKKIGPIEAHGVKTMSIGYLTDTNAPMVWRGPIATGAMMQMFNDVDWGPLDLLLVDTPPGTGDITLTMVQRAPLTGAVIVSTPQEVALADVRRGVAMFRKTQTPILGLVENMSWFEDPSSGARSYIFGEGGAQKLAETLDIPVLGEIPLQTDIREGGDTGTPSSARNGSTGVIFRALAEKLIARLEVSHGKEPPRIIFE